jgi:uncharacterized protein (DUF1501 family)
MSLSRRDFVRLAAGGGALGTLSQLGLAASVAQTATPYRAMVAVFLYGGNDGWNMVVPTDGRYAAYASGRGAGLALKSGALMALTGTPFGLHPAFAPLKPVWDAGGLGVVLNTGPLFQPLDRTLYLQRPDLRPLNLMSHADQQAEWQGMRPRTANTDGFLGRVADKMAATTGLPPLISLAGSNLALIGARATPLILPSSGSLVRTGYRAGVTGGAVGARQQALEALADVSGYGPVTRLTSQAISTAYDQATEANAVIDADASVVDAHFKDPATGAALTSDLARQLQRVARMIEARASLGHDKQAFFVSQGGYDTHANQADAADTATGTQAGLFKDLALALAGFYNAMTALGLSKNVTAFTMSDFGRVYKANAQRGSDHAWGSNHLVVGGALKPHTVHGRYPDQVLGGAEDASSDGRWIPSIAVEEYVGGIAQWYGVAPADMAYVFPNWSMWNGGGRGPVPLFA